MSRMPREFVVVAGTIPGTREAALAGEAGCRQEAEHGGNGSLARRPFV